MLDVCMRQTGSLHRGSHKSTFRPQLGTDVAADDADEECLDGDSQLIARMAIKITKEFL